MFLVILTAIPFTPFPVPSLAADGSVTIGIDPAVIRLSATPGQRWNGSILVSNPTDTTVTLRMRRVNLESAYREGVPLRPLVDEDKAMQQATLAGWLVASDRVTISPRSQSTVLLSLTVPDYAAPGAHYAAVLFSYEGGEAVGSGTTVSPSVGAVVEVSVTAQSNHRVRISKFAARVPVSQRFPVAFDFEVANEGNTVQSLVGELVMDHLIWGQSIRTPVLPARDRYLIPGTTFAAAVSVPAGSGWDDVGIYRATLRFGAAAGAIEESVWVAVIPWPFAIILAAVVVVLGLGARTAGIVWLRRILRRRQRRVRK
jgi:hypothetical protein